MVKLVPRRTLKLAPVVIRLKTDLIGNAGDFLFAWPETDDAVIHEPAPVLAQFKEPDGDEAGDGEVQEPAEPPHAGPDPPGLHRASVDPAGSLDELEGDEGGNGNGEDVEELVDDAEAKEAEADAEEVAEESGSPFARSRRRPIHTTGRRAFCYHRHGTATYAVSALAVAALSALTDSPSTWQTAQQIGLVYGGPPGRVGGLLSGLSSAGLVTRRRPPRTGRSFQWSVTAVGRGLVLRHGQRAVDLVIRRMTDGC
jgi:hypothetical protein